MSATGASVRSQKTRILNADFQGWQAGFSLFRELVQVVLFFVCLFFWFLGGFYFVSLFLFFVFLLFFLSICFLKFVDIPEFLVICCYFFRFYFSVLAYFYQFVCARVCVCASLIFCLWISISSHWEISISLS